MKNAPRMLTWLIAVTLGGCAYMPVEKRSGGYGTSWTLAVSADDAATRPSLVRAFEPDGLATTPAPARRVNSLIVAELGEWSVPSTVVDEAIQVDREEASSRKAASIPSVSVPDYSSRGRFDAWLLLGVSRMPATQPTTGPEAARRIAELDAITLRSSNELADHEITRLCDRANELHADAILLFTTHSTVQSAQSTVFTYLDYLILPMFILPTEYLHGVIAADGWLIDPATRQAFAHATARDTHLRITPLYYGVDATYSLADTQREAILRNVADQLLRRR